MKLLEDAEGLLKGSSLSIKSSDIDTSSDSQMSRGLRGTSSLELKYMMSRDRALSKQSRGDCGPFSLEAQTEMNVSLLFVDMSGFTGAMERFSAYGFAGIECFWSIINKFFGGLLCEVFNRGGDVECFAGDAMLISFPSSTIVDSPICQAIHAAALQNMNGSELKDGEEAYLPNLSSGVNWAGKLASMLAIDAAASILRAMPYECTGVRIGKRKVPLTIHLTVHGGIGTGTCMFNKFSVIQGSSVEKNGFFFPFGLAVVDMTKVHRMSKSGEVILSSNLLQQLFPSQHCDDGGGGYGWAEAGWVKRREDETFMLYSDGSSHALPPPLLGGLLSVDFSPYSNVWPEYSSIRAILSQLDFLLSQNPLESEMVKKRKRLAIITYIAKSLEMYVPKQLKEQMGNRTSDSSQDLLATYDEEHSFQSDKKASGHQRRKDTHASSYNRSDTSQNHSSSEQQHGHIPSNQVSSPMMMVGELREATVGFVKFDTTGLMDLNIKNAKLLRGKKQGGYLSMAWLPSTKVQAPPRDEMTELQNIISECVDAADAVISHGGLVNKFLMDDKGLSMLYAFGTPGYSYEGNSLRAVWVALDIRMRIGDLHKNGFGIGIASGRICVCIMGLPSVRCEYAVLGSTVNLASRLADHSLKLGAGAVLTDSMTIGVEKAELADITLSEGIILEPGIKVHSVGSLKLKGKSEITRIYSAEREHMKVNVNWREQYIWMGKLPTHSSRGPVGRKEEFQALRSYPPLNGTRPNDDGSSYCMIVEGEAGTGKTLLLKYVLSFCGGADLDIMRARLQKSEPRTEVLTNSDMESGNGIYRRFSFSSYFLPRENNEEFEHSSRPGYGTLMHSSDAVSGVYPLFPLPSQDSSMGSSSRESSKELLSLHANQDNATHSTIIPVACTHSVSNDTQNNDVRERMSSTSPMAVSQTDSRKLSDLQLVVDIEAQSDCQSSITQTADTNYIAVAFHCCSAAEQLQPHWPVVNLVSQLLAMCVIPNADGSFSKKDVCDLLSKRHIRVSEQNWTVENLLDTLQLAGLLLIESDEVQSGTGTNSETHKYQCEKGRRSTPSSKRVSWSSLLDDPVPHASLPVSQPPKSSRKESTNRTRSNSNQSTFDGLANHRSMLVGAVSCVFAAVREQQGPLVVIIDNAHMMDSNMMQLMLPLVNCQHNVTFILASRGIHFTHPAASSYYTDLRSLANKCITMGPLQPAQSGQLACHFLGVSGIDDTLFELITQTCNGSPLFIEELCKDLAARGAVMTGVMHSLNDVSRITAHLRSMTLDPNTTTAHPGRRKTVEIDQLIDGDKPRRISYGGYRPRTISSYSSSGIHGIRERSCSNACANEETSSSKYHHIQQQKRTEPESPIGETTSKKISLDLDSSTTGDDSAFTLSYLAPDDLLELEQSNAPMTIDDELNDELWDIGKTYGFLTPLKKSFNVPSCISNAIVANVDRLKLSIDGMVVKVASVIGEVFSCEVLLAVIPINMTEHELQDSLQRLCKHGLLKSTDDLNQKTLKRELNSVQRLSFVNPMVWKSCYGMLLQHYRRGLHIAVARVLLHHGSMKEKGTTVSQVCLHHILQATLSSAPSNEEIAEIGPLVWMQTLREGVGILVHVLETKFQALCLAGSANGYVMMCEKMIKSFQHWLEYISEDKKVEIAESDDSEMLVMEFKLMLIKCRLELEMMGSIAVDTECLQCAFDLRCDPRLTQSPKFCSEQLIQPDLYKAYALQCVSNDYTCAWDFLKASCECPPKIGVVAPDGDDELKYHKLSLEKASLLAMGAIRCGDMERCDICTEALDNWDGWEPLCLLSHDSVAMLLGVLMLTRGLICINFKAFWNERQSLLKYCKSARSPLMVWKVFGWLSFTWFALGEAPSFVVTFNKILDRLSLRGVPNEFYDFNIDMMTIFCELYISAKAEKTILKTFRQTHDLERVIELCSEKNDMINDMLEQILELMRLRRNPMACCIAFEACILAANPSAREETLNIWEETMGDNCGTKKTSCCCGVEIDNDSNLLELWFSLCKVKHLIMMFEEEDDSYKVWNTSSPSDCSLIISDDQVESYSNAGGGRQEKLNDAISKLTGSIEAATNSKHTIRVIQLTCLKVRARILLGDVKNAEKDFKPIKALLYSYSMRYDKICNLCTIDDATLLYEALKHEKTLQGRLSSIYSTWNLISIHQDVYLVYGELSFYEAIERGVFNQGYYGPPKWTRAFVNFLSTSLVKPIGTLVNTIMMTESKRKGVNRMSVLQDSTDNEEQDLFKMPLEEYEEDFTFDNDSQHIDISNFT